MPDVISELKSYESVGETWEIHEGVAECYEHE